MREKRIELAEHILPGHPDKLCDAAVDTIVDYVRHGDPLGQCGLEASCVFDAIHLTGRIAAEERVLEGLEGKLEALVRDAYKTAGYGLDEAGYLWGPVPEDLKVTTNFCFGPLSGEERQNRHLSDDQAICIGYANNRRETDFLPPAHWLARKISFELHRLRKTRGAGEVGPDGTVITRVEVNGDSWIPLHVSISLNHHDDSDWLLLREVAEEAVHRACVKRKMPSIRLNNGGSFVSGGPNGDNGLSGKKLVVDAYGPAVPIGGGAWSGKDFNKVDRAGGLLARELARELVVSRGLHDAMVTLEYIPGCDAPVSLEAIVDGSRLEGDTDSILTNPLNSNKVVSQRYSKQTIPLVELARWGHQIRGVPWENGLPLYCVA